MFKQIGAVVGMNLQSLPQRFSSSAVTMIGIAAVVAVMVSILAIGAGLIQTANRGSSPNRVIILSAGATAAYMGSISREQAVVIGDAPGIKKGPDGKPLFDPQATIIMEVTNRTTGGTANTGFLGQSAEWLLHEPNFKIIKGRMYRPAVRELIVGKNVASTFKNLDVGDHIMLRGSEWSVVGAFTTNGGLAENGIIADTNTVMAAFQRDSYQSVTAELESPQAFRRFSDALTSDPRLKVDVKHENEYVQDQLKQLTVILNVLAYFIGVIMAIGAVFGALNTMYSAVDSRAREIATLRALGFGGFPVVISVMIEALVIAIPGALLGAAVAWLLFNGNAAHIASLTFPVVVTPGLVVLGVIWALVIGVIGGFAPSIRAARLPVATALRAT